MLTNQPGFPDGPVTVLSEDRERNLWVGTYRGGLHRLTRAKVTTYGASQGLVTLSAGESADGGLWVGTSGSGLCRATGGRLEPWDLGETARRYGICYSVLPTHDADLWLGVEGSLLRSERGQAASPLGLEQFQSGESVPALCDDGEGGVWVGTGLGRVLRAHQGQLTLATDRLSGRLVTALVPEPGGGAWIGTSGGLFHFIGGALSVLTRTNGLSNDYIRTLYRTTEGTLWIGTGGGGLARWADGRLANFTTEHGLADNVISQMIQDDAGDFWFGCSRGIFRVRQSELRDLAAGKIRFVHPLLLGRAEGMALEECTGGHSPPCVKTRSGLLCFTTFKGLVVVDPMNFNTHAPSPRVMIAEALVDDRPIEPAEPKFKRLVIPPGKHQVRFRYTAPGASIPERIQFKYRLEGVEDWVEAGTEREVRYQSLLPGHYNFRVTACNSDGVWNESVAGLAFTVLPHYWETGWFRLGTALLLIALGGASAWSWFRRRIARALERERLAVEMQQLRDELAHSSRVSTMGQLVSALTHELGQPLGAILRNAEAAELVMDQAPPDLAEIRAILADIRQDDQRATGVIDHMRAMLKRGKVERTPLPIGELLEEAAALAGHDALQRKVQLTLEVPPGLPPVWGDRVQLQQVLLNLLLNGMDAMSQQPPETRRLVVQARKAEGQMLEVRVRDSGPGIPAENVSRVFEPFFSTKPHGMGLGLAVSKTIIEAHQGRLWVGNLPEGGACFCFTVPATKTG
jgi:signal transduction histidine kinase